MKKYEWWKDFIIASSSWSPRAKQTLEEIRKILSENMADKKIIYNESENLARETKSWEPSLSNDGRIYGIDFMKKWHKEHTDPESQKVRWERNEMLKAFSEDKNAIKKILSKYFKFLNNFFCTTEKYWKNVAIFSCRHWEKDSNFQWKSIYQPLTEKWINQSKKLWKIINDKIKKLWTDNTKFRILVWHEWIDEFLVTALLWFENLPEKWKTWRPYTGIMEYYFTKSGKETILKLIREWEEVNITLSKFKERVNELNLDLK